MLTLRPAPTDPKAKPQTFKKSGPLNVQARTGWAFTAVSPLSQINGYRCVGSTNPTLSVTLTIPDPPAPGTDIGAECEDPGFSYQYTVLRGGPNQGYHYIFSAKDLSYYYYTIYFKL